MQLFVYEYLSSGAAGAASSLPSLQIEGWAMLSALLDDLSCCPGIEIHTLLDPCPKHTPASWPTKVVVHHAAPKTEEKTFRSLAAAADCSLVIAPEFEGILEQRCRWVEEVEGRLLGPAPAAIRLTADKGALADHWQAHGVPTPTVLGTLPLPQPRLPFPVVVKPRYGAGSQATFLVRQQVDLAVALRQATDEDWSSPLIVQAYSPGLAVSVAFLARERERYALPAVEQRLSEDGRFHYLGGRLPLPPDLDRRARDLAERAAANIEGLQGWFGVDLVLGAAPDDSGDVAIEINPRLTTSYLGLRRLAQFNLAGALLALARGLPPPRWEWNLDTIVFSKDGRDSSPC